MEPKPPQGGRLPIWIGGNSEAAYRRVGRLGDGWLASRVDRRGRRAARHRGASTGTPRRPGAIPGAIGLQSMVAPPPRDAAGKTFYATTTRSLAASPRFKAMGFGWVALNATAIFQAGARSVEAMTEAARHRCTTASAPKSADRPLAPHSARHGARECPVHRVGHHPDHARPPALQLLRRGLDQRGGRRDRRVVGRGVARPRRGSSRGGRSPTSPSRAGRHRRRPALPDPRHREGRAHRWRPRSTTCPRWWPAGWPSCCWAST